jgi:hypothetical protein
MNQRCFSHLSVTSTATPHSPLLFMVVYSCPLLLSNLSATAATRPLIMSPAAILFFHVYLLFLILWSGLLVSSIFHQGYSSSYFPFLSIAAPNPPFSPTVTPNHPKHIHYYYYPPFMSTAVLNYVFMHQCCSSFIQEYS